MQISEDIPIPMQIISFDSRYFDRYFINIPIMDSSKKIRMKQGYHTKPQLYYPAVTSNCPTAHQTAPFRTLPTTHRSMGTDPKNETICFFFCAYKSYTQNRHTIECPIAVGPAPDDPCRSDEWVRAWRVIIESLIELLNK